VSPHTPGRQGSKGEALRRRVIIVFGLCIGLSVVGSFPAFAAGRSDCETGHWAKTVSRDGSIVVLEDGSVYQVDAGDAIDSMLWFPTTDIIVCDDKLINTEGNETVSARRLR